jgi:hypothetical protein
MLAKLPTDATHVVLCEGREDQLILDALLSHLGLPEVAVVDVGGKSVFRGNVRSVLGGQQAPNLRAVAIIRDADNSRERQFQSARDAIRDSGHRVPRAVGRLTSGFPSAGILIVPTGSEQGEMEDLCLAATRRLPEFACVSEFLECSARLRSTEYENPAKAQMHAWLAGQTQAYVRLGEAAQKGWIPFDSPAFADLRDFWQRFAAAG